MPTQDKKKIIVAVIVTLVVIGLGVFFAVKAGNNKKEEKIEYYEVTLLAKNNQGEEVTKVLRIKKGEKLSSKISELRDIDINTIMLNGKKFDINTEITESIKLVATYKDKDNQEEKEYKVVFDSDNGSEKVTLTVKENEKVTKPEDPSKEGYKFVSWQLEDKDYDFEDIVTKDITLKAKWEEEKQENNNEQNNNQQNNNQSNNKPVAKTKYTVKFDTNGGSEIGNQTVEEGNKVTRPSDPSKSGSVFTGWTLNGSTYDFNTPVNSNITLVANYRTAQNYTVKFDTKTGIINSQTVTEGNKVTKPSDPVKEGHKFTGWTLNGSAYDFNSPIKSNITLVANYKQKSYTVEVRKVDQYSPTVTLTAKEEGAVITVGSFEYTDGTFICSGTNANTNVYALDGETTLTLVLSGGTKVRATIVNV